MKFVFVIYLVVTLIAFVSGFVSYIMNQAHSVRHFRTVIFISIAWPLIFATFPFWPDPVYDFDDWLDRRRSK